MALGIVWLTVSPWTADFLISLMSSTPYSVVPGEPPLANNAPSPVGHPLYYKVSRKLTALCAEKNIIVCFDSGPVLLIEYNKSQPYKKCQLSFSVKQNIKNIITTSRPPNWILPLELFDKLINRADVFLFVTFNHETKNLCNAIRHCVVSTATNLCSYLCANCKLFRLFFDCL